MIRIAQRSFLFAALASILAGPAIAAQRPNFLWLLAEDFGPALGCYGQKGVSTPNLDKLSREGVRYDHFYTTAPVCSPSRSAFMTGMYQTTIGAHQHRTPNKLPLPSGVKTLPEWMHEAGYFTANLRTLPESFQFKGTGKTDWNFIAPEKRFDSDAWSDLKGHQPFFAQINFHETHRKFNGGRKADPATVPLPPYYPDHPVAREDYARYLDAAMELDRKVGVILAQLETDGLADNTVLVFMGDNGEAHVRGKQFCYEEGLHVPLIIRWPKAFQPPAHFRADSTDERLLESIDLAPTFLSLAGAEIPPKLQGRPFLGNNTGPPKEYVFGARDRCDETAMRIRTVRDSRYRYIRNFTPEVPLLAPNNYKETQYPVWNLLKELNAQGKLTPLQATLCAPRLPDEELYDMRSDPHQVNNLARSSKAEHKEARERLANVLAKWIKDTGDKGDPSFGLAATTPITKPNIVFLLADDLGWADLKCYGSSFHETPHLDQLARDGMRFTTFYAAGSVCSPTRSSILTGKYPVRTGITDWIPGQNVTGRKLVQPRPRRQLALEEFTFAEAMKESGYQTMYVGKWHLGGKGFLPTDQGFDTYIGDEEGENSEGIQEPRLKRRLESTERFTTASIDLLQRRNPEEPFLLFLSYHDVHTPIQPMPGLVKPYEQKAKSLAGETPRQSEHQGQTRMRQDNPAYASMVSAVDQSVGRLRRTLDELGLAKNTIVLFASDNGGLATQRNPGPTSNAPLRAGKGWLYEGGIRVPLIVLAPGMIKPGSTTDVPLISCDFYPTLLDLAGLPQRPEQHLDGLSFVSVLQGASPRASRTLFWHYPHYHGSTWTPGAALRDGNWKLLEFFEDDSVELYNLDQDPSEKKNLALSNREKTRELRGKLHLWQQSVNAQKPATDSSPAVESAPKGKKRKR